MTLRLKENIEQKNFLITQSPNHLITLKNVCCGFHSNNILTLLALTPCDRAETLAMTVFFWGGGAKL